MKPWLKYFFALSIGVTGSPLKAQDVADYLPPARAVKTKSLVYYQKTTLQWFELPEDIPFISNRFIPGSYDLGNRYLEERFGRCFLKNGLWNDWVDSCFTAGTLRKLNWIQASDLYFGFEQKEVQLPALLTRPLINPFRTEERMNYQWEVKQNTLHFRPKGGRNWGASGFITRTDSVVRLELKIGASQGLRLADSAVFEAVWHQGLLKRSGWSIWLHEFDFKGVYKTFIEFELSDSMLEKNGSMNLQCRQMWVEGNDGFKPSLAKRPLPLSKEETNNLDSFEKYLNHDGAFIADSGYAQLSWPFFQSWALTGTRSRVKNHAYFNLPPLWKGVGLNTVEGFYYVFQPSWIKENLNRRILAKAQLRYAFNEKRLRYSGEWHYAFSGPKGYLLGVEAGSYVKQFNRQNPIGPFINGVNVLLWGKNYLKLYQSDFVNFKAHWQIRSGWQMHTELEFEYRRPLFNLDFFNDFRDYTPNNPISDPENLDLGFEAHRSVQWRLNMSYQFNQQYRISRGAYVPLPAESPRLLFEYRKGLPILGGETQFDFVSLGVAQKRKWGQLGHSLAQLSFGSFFSTVSLPFIDFEHFNGQQVRYIHSLNDAYDELNRFYHLPYYDYSSARHFVEAHVLHDFQGYFWKQLPYIGHLNYSFYTGLNFVYTPDQGRYSEVFLGINQIFGIAKLQFLLPIPGTNGFPPSYRFGLTINHMFYRKNRLH